MTNATPFADLARPATPEAASLSPDRAFVVHFYAAKAGADIQAGRAEHVRSGRTTHFGSWQELATFVAETVATPLR